jgi:hypothetical protein
MDHPLSFVNSAPMEGRNMGNPVQLDEIWTKRILDSISGLEYGHVQIIVHDGKIVQIERTERKRFEISQAKKRES